VIKIYWCSQSIVFVLRMRVWWFHYTPGSAFYDHRVSGRALFPGAGMLQLTFDAACAALPSPSSSSETSQPHIAILGAAIPAPLIMPSPSTSSAEGAAAVVVMCRVSVCLDGGTMALTSLSGGYGGRTSETAHLTARPAKYYPRTSNGNERDIKHIGGGIAEQDRNDASVLSIDAQRASHTVPVDVTAAYAAMSEVGLQYGANFRSIESLHQREEEGQDQSRGIGASSRCNRMARMRAPESCGSTVALASLVDGSMQLAAPLIPAVSGSGSGTGKGGRGRVLRVPAAIAAYASGTNNVGGGGTRGFASMSPSSQRNGREDDNDDAVGRGGIDSSTDHRCFLGGDVVGDAAGGAGVALVGLVSRTLGGRSAGVAPVGGSATASHSASSAVEWSRDAGSDTRVRYVFDKRAQLSSWTSAAGSRNMRRHDDAACDIQSMRTHTVDATRAATSAAAAAQAASAANAHWSTTSSSPSSANVISSFVVGGGPIASRLGNGAVASACVRGVARSVALEESSGGGIISDLEHGRDKDHLGDHNRRDDQASKASSDAPTRGAGAELVTMLVPSRHEASQPPALFSSSSPSERSGDLTPYRGFIAEVLMKGSASTGGGGAIESFACRITGATTADVVNSSSPVRIIGGTGAIGMAVSDWLVAGGGTRWVTLTGRSGRSKSRVAGQGSNSDDSSNISEVPVTAVACDCATAVESTSPYSNNPTGGSGDGSRATGVVVIHAGGVLCDSLLPRQTAGSFREVFAPKLGAAMAQSRRRSSSSGGGGNAEVAGSNLAAPAGDILFSSISALLGSAGQTNYAAANAGIDAVVEPSRWGARNALLFVPRSSIRKRFLL
jgi:hypothetical protein